MMWRKGIFIERNFNGDFNLFLLWILKKVINVVIIRGRVGSPLWFIWIISRIRIKRTQGHIGNQKIMMISQRV